jgi:DNA-binding XRE family transcriptional regulator
MRIQDWHERRVASNPAYAEATRLVEATQQLADMVVSLRVGAGMSQAELALHANTTQAAISHLETGDANPTVDTVVRVLVALLGASQADVNAQSISHAEATAISTAGGLPPMDASPTDTDTPVSAGVSTHVGATTGKLALAA